jgi:integrase
MASIRVNKNSLCIDFTYRGERKRIYLGVNDTPQNRNILNVKVDQLNNAIKGEKLGLGKVDFDLIFPGLNLYKDEIKAEEGRYNTEMFDVLYLEWVDMKTHISKNTRRTILSFYRNHISPFIGHKLLKDITEKDVRMMMSVMVKVNRNAVVNRKVATLRSFFNELVEDGHLKETPFKKIKTLRNEKVDINPFNQDELIKLLEGFAKKYPDYENFVAFLAFSGCRPNEVVGLKWDKIDWENRKILIREGVVLGEETMLKTESSIRDMDMTEPLETLLLKQKELQLDSEYVFVNGLGRRICWECFRPKYHNVLKEQGLKARPAYQLRHTFASMAIKNGEDIVWVSRMLGHVNLRTTLSTYTRYIPSKERKDGTIISGIFENMKRDENG